MTSESKLKQKEIRLQNAKEKDNELLVQGLCSKLADEWKVDLIQFKNPAGILLPPYYLLRGRHILAFLDILFGKMEDYIKIHARSFRNGIFTTEHLGTPKSEDIGEVKPVRYGIFLLSPEETYKWSYNTKKVKPYPTIESDKELFVYINRKEWEPF